MTEITLSVEQQKRLITDILKNEFLFSNYPEIVNLPELITEIELNESESESLRQIEEKISTKANTVLLTKKAQKSLLKSVMKGAIKLDEHPELSIYYNNDWIELLTPEEKQLMLKIARSLILK